MPIFVQRQADGI